MFFLEDVRVVDLGLRLELKSDLGLEKVGDHCSRWMVMSQPTFSNVHCFTIEALS